MTTVIISVLIAFLLGAGLVYGIHYIIEHRDVRAPRETFNIEFANFPKDKDLFPDFVDILGEPVQTSRLALRRVVGVGMEDVNINDGDGVFIQRIENDMRNKFTNNAIVFANVDPAKTFFWICKQHIYKFVDYIPERLAKKYRTGKITKEAFVDELIKHCKIEGSEGKINAYAIDMLRGITAYCDEADKFCICKHYSKGTERDRYFIFPTSAIVGYVKYVVHKPVEELQTFEQLLDSAQHVADVKVDVKERIPEDEMKPVEIVPENPDLGHTDGNKTTAGTIDDGLLYRAKEEAADARLIADAIKNDPAGIATQKLMERLDKEKQEQKPSEEEPSKE